MMALFRSQRKHSAEGTSSLYRVSPANGKLSRSQVLTPWTEQSASSAGASVGRPRVGLSSPEGQGALPCSPSPGPQLGPRPRELSAVLWGSKKP